MRRISLTIALGILTISFKPLSYKTSNKNAVSSGGLNLSDTVLVIIKSENLSEDFSKNDELLILAYVSKDSSVLDTAILKKRLTLTDQKMQDEFQWKITPDLADKDLLIFLIEQDADTPIEQIDAILRIHSSNVINAFKNRNYSSIEKYLGDEDILGIKLLEKPDFNYPIEFYFRGLYRMDRYEYLLTFKK